MTAGSLVLLTPFFLLNMESSAAALTSSLDQATKNSRDGVWKAMDEKSIPRGKEGRPTVAQTYRTFRLDKNALMKVLAQAPREFTEAAKHSRVELSLPMPDGSFSRFRIVESPITEAGLPTAEIKTYSGQGIDDPTATTRFDWSPTGLHAIILSVNATIYVDPYSRRDNTHYLSYDKRAAIRKNMPVEPRRKF
jgi:hypothetical protein